MESRLGIDPGGATTGRARDQEFNALLFAKGSSMPESRSFDSVSPSDVGQPDVWWSNAYLTYARTTASDIPSENHGAGDARPSVKARVRNERSDERDLEETCAWADESKAAEVESASRHLYWLRPQFIEAGHQ